MAATRRRDWNALLRACLLSALAIFLGHLILTGKVSLYIHPKFSRLTSLSALACLLIALSQFWRAFASLSGDGRPVRLRAYAAFILALCAALVSPAHTFGADLVQQEGLNLTASSELGFSSPAPVVAPADDTGPIVITNGNFLHWMLILHSEGQRYVGRRVVMEGFAFDPKELGPSQFVLARLVVTCHVAHAAPDGLLVTLADRTRPAQDSWSRVEGTLQPMTYQGKPTMGLRVEKILPIFEPAEPYVFP